MSLTEALLIMQETKTAFGVAEDIEQLLQYVERLEFSSVVAMEIWQNWVCQN